LQGKFSFYFIFIVWLRKAPARSSPQTQINTLRRRRWNKFLSYDILQKDKILRKRVLFYFWGLFGSVHWWRFFFLKKIGGKLFDRGNSCKLNETFRDLLSPLQVDNFFSYKNSLFIIRQFSDIPIFQIST
jgi:hypothetical protein